MKLIILIGLYLAAQQADGSSINRNTSNLMEDLKEFRNTLVERLDDLPNEFFDLELTMHNSELAIEDDDTLIGDVTNFRKELAGLSGGMQDELFDIELSLNNLLVEEDKEDSTDDTDDETDDDDTDDETDEDCDTVASWYLGMNLNPGDGHIMDYTTGWRSTDDIGSSLAPLSQDYKNMRVWTMPADYISIVRHQNRTVDAVKVFRFTESGISLYDRFDSSNPDYYRKTVTSGGPIQESISASAPYMDDDPIFSVGGDLAFNWGYNNNGHRIVLTGGHLSPEGVNDMNTHGLGNHVACDPRSGTPNSERWKHEISVIQDCDWTAGCNVYQVEGTDHSAGVSWYRSGPVYGNYAIFVSQMDATTFPEPGYVLGLDGEVLVEECH